MREDVQRPQPRLVGVGPDGVRPPPTPPSALSVDVDELVFVVEDVIRQAIESRGDRLLLGFVGDELMVDGIHEVVADDLVRAGVPFPSPELVGRIVPLAIARLQVIADFDEGSCGEARDTRDALQAQDRLHPASRVLPRINLAGHLVAKRFRRDIHRRPQAIVVARPRPVRGNVTCYLQHGIGREAPAMVPLLDTLDEDARLLLQRHRFVVDSCEPLPGFNPRCTLTESNAGDHIVWKPALPGKVFPAAAIAIDAKCSFACADPRGPG